MTDFVSPSPTTSQSHHNADISSKLSLKSISSVKNPLAFLYTNSSFSNTKICAQFIERMR